MSYQGNGNGGHRRSSRPVKGKVVAYARDSSPDTDDEYDAVENPRTRADRVVAENLQRFFDAETDDVAEEVLPAPSPGITIGGNARLSGTPRRSSGAPVDVPPTRMSSKRLRATRAPPSVDPMDPEFIMPGIRYPPQGGIHPRNVILVLLTDTPLLMNLANHLSMSVHRFESDFHKLLANASPEYRVFLVELGFGPFLSIPYMSLSHPLVRCWVERFFHHTGTFQLSTCEMRVLLLDWSTILGIRFGGKLPPNKCIYGREALAIMGLNDFEAYQGITNVVFKVKYLKKLLEEEKSEPPNKLRYRQWVAYFIFSCFLGDDQTTVPTPIVGCVLHLILCSPWLGVGTRLGSSGLPLVLSSITALRWIASGTRIMKSWELFMGEKAVRQLSVEVVVPADPPSLMTIEDYIPATPRDAYLEGMNHFLDLEERAILTRDYMMTIQRLEDQLVRMDDPTHCCFSTGEIDLVLILEKYAELLQLDSSFNGKPFIPSLGPRSNLVLEKFLGLISKVIRGEIRRVDETWQKASISLDFFMRYFSQRHFSTDLIRDFSAGEEGWVKFRNNAFKIAFLGIFLFPTSIGRIDLGVIPLVLSEGKSIIPAILCETMRLLSYYQDQDEGAIDMALPFTGAGNDWALYLLNLPLGEWSWKVILGPVEWRPWTHCSRFNGIPFPGMWKLLSTVKDFWERRFSEMDFIEDGLPADSSVTYKFVEWREEWSPSFFPQPTVQPCMLYSLVPSSLRASASDSRSGRVADLGRKLSDARAELTLRVDKVQDELDSLRSYTQALTDPSTGRPHDIVHLQPEFDESEAVLSAAPTSMGTMQV
uniref:Aminotransferase-like plant mobile domain-containing protein n=1 Tax=Fagus sylvatica TaxID=28930 RepID=A0A2N9G1L4_FAGSY